MPDLYEYENVRQTYNLGRVSADGIVHAAFRKRIKKTGETPQWPHYPGCPVPSSRLVRTSRPVTCKRCLAMESTS